MNEIMKIDLAIEDSNTLFREITKAIKNETKVQQGRFLIMVLVTLGASSLGNMLTGKWMVRAGYGNRERKGMLRTGCEGSMKFLWSKKDSLLHPIL